MRTLGGEIGIPNFRQSDNILTQKRRVPKQCPWGATATNSTLFSEGCSFFLNNHVCLKKGTEIAPQGAPIYGQQNSTPRGTVLAPLFF